jgi:hypothetical protein
VLLDRSSSPISMSSSATAPIAVSARPKQFEVSDGISFAFSPGQVFHPPNSFGWLRLPRFGDGQFTSTFIRAVVAGVVRRSSARQKSTVFQDPSEAK